MTPNMSRKYFQSKLSALKRRRHFVRWGESAGLARELATLLEDLKAGVGDPCAGAKLVAAFYETDEATLGNCDDSSGHVGDVYRYDARDLFVSYARRCEDKDWLGSLVLDLNREDGYGVRDSLIDAAAEYLSEPVMRSMIERLLKAAGQEADEYNRRHWLLRVESLAKQLKDAPLFEKTRIAAWGSLSTAACVDIAKVYLESGDAQTALSWLGRIPVAETYMAYERDGLLLEIYGKLGDREKQTETAWRIFRSHRSGASLAGLLDVIGEDKREQVIAGEAEIILQEKRLSHSNAAFLLALGLMDQAETYLLARAAQLNGDLYSSLLPLAKTLETAGRSLAASVIYRALLDSILRRAQSKYYSHGVRYLKKLDRLAGPVSDWRDVITHEAYLGMLRQNHGRKSAFWPRYENETGRG